jgi:uncharacterized RDD family membrane protein YckC
MFCAKCGTALAEGAGFCGGCGQRVGIVSVAAPAPGYVPPPILQRSPYAGFWLRFVAYLIDAAILSVGFGIVAILVAAFLGVSLFHGLNHDFDNADEVVPVMLIGFIFLAVVLLVAGMWLYYALMESSVHQGTLGKMALGLTVTDLQGRRVSFGRATGRYFAKMITGLIPFAIGYIMAGFTEKKQALHDMVAGCLVLRRV